jgi:hypothetical protein
MVEFARRSHHVVIDADSRCEPVDLWETHLPSSMRERTGVRYSDRLGTQHAGRGSRAIPMGLAGLGNAGMHQNQTSATPCTIPTTSIRVDGTRRAVAVMDRGIDIAVLYCGLGQSLGGFTDVDLQSRRTRFGTLDADWTSTDPGRLVGTAVIPPTTPAAARRCNAGPSGSSPVSSDRTR